MQRNTTIDGQRGYVAPQSPRPGIGYTPPQPPSQHTPQPSSPPPVKK